MSIGRSTALRVSTVDNQCSIVDSVRILIAEQLGVEVERVGDWAHFYYDLGIDWLDRLELIIEVEEFAGLEFEDEDIDNIEFVGDLMCYIEDRSQQIEPTPAKTK